MSHDVIIIGYGPVGALAALSLADAGLNVLVLERSTLPTQLPRAVGLDGETLRAFQRLGLADEIAGLCQPPREPNQLAFANSKHEPLFGLDIANFGPNGWPDIAFFDQPELEVELRQIISTRDRIEIRLGQEVTAIRQDAEGVTVLSRAGGEGPETDARSSYAIGCDGASSFVRAEIGIGWQSLDYDQDWLVLDITQNEKADLPLVTMQVCDPARLASYICVKDPNRRWEFQLLPGETREEMLAPEKIRELLDPWTAPDTYEIRRSAVYQFHAATAESWRVGRVFLAGDAAHQTPPFLGQGLNAGFRDAVNLGWKLPLVLSNACDESLLDTYQDERDDHARSLVEQAVSVGKLMEVLAAREAGLPDPHPPESINLNLGGPVIPPIRGGILIDSQYDETHRAGELLRQPMLRAPDGSEQRLDKHLGQGFNLVVARAADLQISAEADSLLKRLGARVVALDDFEVVKGQLDPLFETHPAVLVRPDRYIFGVVDEEWPLNRLLKELERKMGHRGV